MIGIYLIRNKVNGKCYVGQAIDIEARWKRHIRESKNPKFPINKAIKKYGVDNFEFSVVELCTAEQLNDREIHWIDEFNSFNNGYNCTIGGGGRNEGKNCYSAEYKMAWQKANPEKVRASQKAYKELNPDKVRASQKAYYEANKEKVRAANKERYDKSKDDPEFKEKECARVKAYREANREKVKATKKALYEKVKDDPEFKEKQSVYHKAYYEANREKLRAYNKAYYEAHKKKVSDETDSPLF